MVHALWRHLPNQLKLKKLKIAKLSEDSLSSCTKFQGQAHLNDKQTIRLWLILHITWDFTSHIQQCS